MSRITAIGSLICLCAGLASAVSSDVNIMRSESKASSKKIDTLATHVGAGDDSTVASAEEGEEETSDEHESAEVSAEDEEDHERESMQNSLLELGSEDDLHEQEEEDEEPDEEDERQKGKGKGKGKALRGRDRHRDEQEEDDEDDERQHWATDVHHIPASVFKEFEDIQREGKNVTVDHVMELISEEHLVNIPETEKMVAVKMVDPPAHADMEIEQFIAKETPAGFIAMVLKGKVNAGDPEGAEMTLAQFRAADPAHRRDGSQDPEAEDIHFLPASTFDALAALYHNGTGDVTREAIEALMTEERLKTLPDTEQVVPVKIEFFNKPLPMLLNSTEPMAFLDKVIKGKDAVPHSKNLTLGEIRGFQEDDRKHQEEGASEEEEGEGHHDEHNQDEEGDEHSKEGSSVEQADDKKNPDAGGASDEKKADNKEDPKEDDKNDPEIEKMAGDDADKTGDDAADPEIEKMAGKGDDDKDTKSVTE